MERAKCNLILGENLTSVYMDLYEHPECERWKVYFVLHQKDFEQLQGENIDKMEDITNILEIVRFFEFRFD